MQQTITLNNATGRWVLISTILASSMGFIQGSALNVALDALQRDLEASATELLWVVNAYLLFLASLILIGGSLGDHYGRRRVFGAGIVIFTLGSVGCGLAPSTALLITARVVQGVGAALMVPGSLAIITALFSPMERGRAIGYWSAASTITTLGGPVLGGYFADELSWRFVFFINVPLAVIALYALTKIPENRDQNASPRLDYLGAALVTLGLAGLTYGLVTLGDRSQLDPSTQTAAVAALIGGVFALIAFIVSQVRGKNPMMDLALFRSRTFSGANAMTAFLYAALSGALLFLPLNLTQVQGYSAFVAGFSLFPFSVLLAVMSPWAGSMLDRYGPRLLLTIGPVIVGFGFLLFALPGITDGPEAYWVTYFPAVVGIGIGMGITVAPLTTTVMNAAPSDRSGVASGINNAVTRSSQVLSTALIGALALSIFALALQSRTDTLSLPVESQAALLDSASDFGNTQPPPGLDAAAAAEVQAAIDWAFVDAFRLVNVAGAVLCFISALMAALILERKRPDPDPAAMT